MGVMMTAAWPGGPVTDIATAYNGISEDPNNPYLLPTLSYLYMQCSFYSTSHITNQQKNTIYPGLRAMYECDALASGLTPANMATFTAPADSNALCMNDPNCVAAYQKLMDHPDVTATFQYQ